jgi:hypothetical protein
MLIDSTMLVVWPIDRSSSVIKKKIPNLMDGTVYASETWILTKRDRKQINIFERKVYRRILGPLCDKKS